ncbi:MAG: DMT family transporter [Pseudomonadota bacterium]
MTPPAAQMSPFEIVLLIGLALVWGGSFVFAEVALEALPPLTVVLIRVGLGAITILAVVLALGKRLPTHAGDWGRLAVMSVLNNVIPFSLIVWGQTQITASLASILNAATPIFALLVAHVVTADERISANKMAGVLLGFAGVAILIGPAALFGEATVLGQLAVLGAALSYGCAAAWGRRLAGLEPMVVAAGQLTVSTLLMLPLAFLVERPLSYPMPAGEVIASLVALATLSTAFAYIMFFRILRGAGAINVSLVTLLVPVSAIGLGAFWLGEVLTVRQVVGAAIIAAALVVIDGRLLRRGALGTRGVAQ